MSECKSCGAEMAWVLTEAGKRMPVDAESGVPVSSQAGNLVPTGDLVSTERGAVPVVRVAPAGEVPLFPDPSEQRWLSHFVTCPNADQHRKSR